jgi:hypothetical protein
MTVAASNSFQGTVKIPVPTTNYGGQERNAGSTPDSGAARASPATVSRISFPAFTVYSEHSHSAISFLNRNG